MHRVEQFSMIAGDIGHILRFVSIGASLPLIVTVIYGEWNVFLPMASVPFTLFLLGTALTRIPSEGREARLSQALFAVALIWLICAIVGALPFFLSAGMPYLDSVFEAMSGWTDTGLTLVPDVDALPHTLLFWRSLMQWFGGLGIVAFTVSLLSRSGLTQFRLYRSEGRSEAFMPSVVSTGYLMWKIYIILTLVSILLIKLSGVSFWDAINIALVAIATGGFSVHSAGIPYYQNMLLELLIIPVMIAGALPFKIYYVLYYKRNKVSLFKDEQVRLLFILIGLGVLVVTYDLFFLSGLDITTSLRQGLFMTVAGVTSTGFQIASPNNWAPVTVLFLCILMFIGGSSGSTAGGIKLSRIALSYRGIIWWFKRVFVSGKVLVPFKYEGKTIPGNVAELEVSKNMLTIILYILVIFVSTVIIMHFDPVVFDTSNVLFEVISAICNNGISTGLVSPAMSPISKICFILIMWIGRLEVMPVIVLFMALFKGFDSRF